ncbi:hypothetical protein C8R45DRAFT_923291 [Mycena sanguinolenta]|nr:hypothetical protein C8R45DRAFT_923291 [Mycena sanguinolenta]
MSQKSTHFCLFSRKATRLSAKATRLVWEWLNPVSRGDTSSSALPLSHHHPRYAGAQPKLKEAMFYSFGVWGPQVVVLAIFHSSRPRRLQLCGEHPRRRQSIQTEKFNGHRRQKQMHVLSVATGSQRGLEVPTTLFRALAYIGGRRREAHNEYAWAHEPLRRSCWGVCSSFLMRAPKGESHATKAAVMDGLMRAFLSRHLGFGEAARNGLLTDFVYVPGHQ